MATAAPARPAGVGQPRRPPRKKQGIKTGEGMWGWLFVSPALLGLLVFLVVPMLIAFYVSLLRWNG